VDPEGWSVDGVWRVRVVTHCRVNQTLGVWVLYITSLVSESMNWVLKTHREERVSSLVRWLLEIRAIGWRSGRSGLVVVPRGVCVGGRVGGRFGSIGHSFIHTHRPGDLCVKSRWDYTANLLLTDGPSMLRP